MSEPEEKIILRRIRAGDEKAYRDVYIRYHKRLYSFAFQYLKNRELSEDAVQDAFIRLWDHRDRMTSNVKSFLFTTVRNHVLNMIRNNKRRTLQKIRLAQQEKRAVNRTEEVILYSEYQRILTDALNGLTDGKREIFELKSFHGLSNREISDKLGITINTVKSQYYHASRFIKDYLEKHAGIRSGT